MNNQGNIRSLVASQPGNRNALKHGVHSERRIFEVAAEFEQTLLARYDFSPAQRPLLRALAREAAIIELIDAHLDAQGLIDRKGKAHTLLKTRDAASRRYMQLLDRLTPTMERQDATPTTPATNASEQARQEIENIAAGRYSHATPREQLAAAKILLDHNDQRSGRTVNLVFKDGDDDYPRLENEDGTEYIPPPPSLWS